MQVSSCWTKRADSFQTAVIARDLARMHLAHLDSTWDGLRHAVETSDFHALCHFDFQYSGSDGVTPNLVRDALEGLHARQAVALYSKNRDLEIGCDKEAAAFGKWQSSEASCKDTNALFRQYERGNVSFPPVIERQLLRARRLARAILGACPQLSDLEVAFGPGATASIKKKEASVQRKLAEHPSCSLDLLASGLIPEVVRAFPHWFDNHATEWYIDDDGFLTSLHDFAIREGVLEFVPKSAKEYRTTDKQPTVCTMLQSGVGRHIARRLLLKAGIDIHDQSVNRRAAQSGSVNGDLATIDLSNASDTISTNLVRFLVGRKWFSLLSATRTSTTSYKGKSFVLEKFSSQGNGFTFPLETLIFYCLVLAASDAEPFAKGISAYGDDLICKSTDYIAVVRLLEFSGFSVNKLKSYNTGPFRESCGGDYFLGVNIRPWYLKRCLSAENLFQLHNYYVRSMLPEFAKKVLGYIPKSVRLYGPDGYGDGHLISNRWVTKTRKLEREDGYSGSYFKSYRKGGNKHISIYPGDYITPLYLTYIGGSGEFDPLKIRGNSLEFHQSGRPYYSVPRDEDDPSYEVMSIYTFSQPD